MIPCAISGSRSRPRSLVNVIIIVIWIIAINGLVGVVGVVGDHHIFPPGQRWTDGDLLLGLIGFVAPLRPRALTGPLVVMLAVLVPSHEPLERRHQAAGAVRVRRRPWRLLLLLGRRLALGVRMSHARISDDGDRSRLHLLLRCAPAPRWLILRALA